tara:strand:+ start:353 stop:499 length:147 start_codon:yes stop_codon:yes gene_type:complete
MKISSFIKAVTTRPDSPVWLEQLGTPIVNQYQNLALVLGSISVFLEIR